MKKLLLILILFNSLYSFSQNKKFVLKTNGYYYSKIKKQKKDFNQVSWLKPFKKNDTIYGINPMIINDYETFSTSDNYYGVGKRNCGKNNNSFTGALQNLKCNLKSLKKTGLKGKYKIKNDSIEFVIKTKIGFKRNNIVKYEDAFFVTKKGKIINDSSFVITKIKVFDLRRNRLKSIKNVSITYNFSPYKFNKKIVYSDEDLTILTKKDYLKNPLNKSYFEYEVENDSLMIIIKVKRQKVGRVSKEVLNEIKKQLSASSNKQIDSNQTIVINYFPGQDRCNRGSGNRHLTKKYNTYSKKISKKKNVIQFFIYKNKKGTKKYSKKIKWFKDPNQLIERTFFKFHYPCGSYVILRPNGNYFSQRGEYNISLIPDKL